MLLYQSKGLLIARHPIFKDYRQEVAIVFLHGHLHLRGIRKQFVPVRAVEESQSRVCSNHCHFRVLFLLQLAFFEHFSRKFSEFDLALPTVQIVRKVSLYESFVLLAQSVPRNQSLNCLICLVHGHCEQLKLVQAEEVEDGELVWC